MTTNTVCDDVRDDFSALLDGDLTPEETEMVEEHLMMCSDCLRELDGLKKLHTVYGAMPKAKAPDGFKVSLRDESKPVKIGLRDDVRRSKSASYKPLMAAAAMLFLLASFWGLVQTGSGGDGTEPAVSDAVFDVALVESDDAIAAGDVLEESFADAPVESASAPAAVAMKSVTEPEMATVEAELSPVDEKIVAAEARSEQFARSAGALAEPSREFSTARVENRNIWTQKGYADQAVQDLEMSSPALSTILAGSPELAKIVNIIDEVIFEYDGNWYRVLNPQ